MSKNYIRGLSVVLFLFVMLFVMLAFNMRLATDDYFFIWDVKTHGIIQSVYLQYIQWCGRYFAVFLYDVVYKLFGTHQVYYSILLLFILLLLIYGVFRFFLSIANQFDLKINKVHTWLAAVSFSALLFFLTIDIGETWFWYCSMSSYLWSIIAFIWGISFLFSKKNNVLDYSGIILCFVYFGGASEVYSLVFGMLLLALFVLKLKQPFNKKLIVALLSLSISFAFVVVAKGNYSRAAQFPDPTVSTTLMLTGRMLLKLVGWFLPQKLICILIFSVPFLLIGHSFNKGEKILLIDFLKKFKRISIVLLLSILIVFVSIAVIMSQSGEYRVWFIISFLIGVYLSGIAYCAGMFGLFSEKQIRFIKNISIPVGIVFMCYTFFTQYSITSKYATTYDERIAHLEQLNKKTEKDTVIIIPPLSRSGMVYSSEITSDTFNFSNRELRLGLNLKYHIVVENK